MFQRAFYLKLAKSLQKTYRDLESLLWISVGKISAVGVLIKVKDHVMPVDLIFVSLIGLGDHHGGLPGAGMG